MLLLPWLALIGTARAGEPAAIWTSAEVSDLGTYGFAAGDLDDDGEVDFIASGEGAGPGFTVQLSGSGEAFYELPVGFEHGFGIADLDGDSDLEILLSMPDNEDDRGLFAVLEPFTDFKTLKGGLRFSVEGILPDFARLGSAWLLDDLDGDGEQELLLGAPGGSSPSVFAFDVDALSDAEADLPDAVSTWRGDFSGYGAGIVRRGEEIIVARCLDDGAGSCDGGGGLLARSRAEWTDDIFYKPGAPDPAPGTALLRLDTLPDLDGDDTDELLWISASQLVVLGSAGGDSALHTLAGDGTFTDALPTEAGLWASDDSSVYWIARDSIASGDPAALAGDDFALQGARLAAAGDVDGDGCADAYAAEPGSSTVYLLSAPCTDDTGPDDTGPGTGGDSGGDAAPCEPGLGWSCASASPARGWLWTWALAAGLLWTRRRAQGLRSSR